MMKGKLKYLLNDPRHRGWDVYCPTIHGWEEAVLLSHNDGRIAGVVSLAPNSMLYYGPEKALVMYRIEIDHMIVSDNGIHLAEGVLLRAADPEPQHRTSQVAALIRYVDEHNARLDLRR